MKLLLLLMLACVGTTDVGTTDVGTTDVGTTDVGTTDVGTTDVGTTDPTPPATVPEAALQGSTAADSTGTEGQKAPEPSEESPTGRISARHILVSWEGAEGADPKLHRSRAEALSRAQELRDRLVAGEDFAALAREASDDPVSARDGGSLGSFARGRMAAPFEAAAFGLSVGQRSDLVESPFGFHIIERLPLVEVHLAQILIQWQGLPGATVTRSREEARTRAEEALQRLNAGVPVAEVARGWSDGPAGIRGGDLGWFEKGKINSTFDPIVFRIPPGSNSGIVETSLGFHILVRLDGT